MSSRVTLVTGSARGLGLEVAQRLALRGDRVHVVWRSEGPEAAALRKAFDGRAHRADVTRPAEVEALIAEVLEEEGGIDVVVHAVGEYVSGPLESTTSEELRRMLSSNVESSLLLFDAVRPSLRASTGGEAGGLAGGAAVFFGCSGLEGMRARRETAAYAAAKSALRVLVRSWAVEEAPYGLRVNMVSPGHVPHAHAHPDTLDAERLAAIPLGRPGTPQDLASAVAWLTSEEASYVTGVDLPVTGGWMV